MIVKRFLFAFRQNKIKLHFIIDIFHQRRYNRIENFCIYTGCNIAKIEITYDYRGIIEWPTYKGCQRQQDIYFKKYTELHEKYDKYIKK